MKYGWILKVSTSASVSNRVSDPTAAACQDPNLGFKHQHSPAAQLGKQRPDTAFKTGRSQLHESGYGTLIF